MKLNIFEVEIAGFLFRQSEIQNLSLSHTEGSKIENGWELFAIVVALTLCGAGVQAQRPRKSPGWHA